MPGPAAPDGLTAELADRLRGSGVLVLVTEQAVRLSWSDRESLARIDTCVADLAERAGIEFEPCTDLTWPVLHHDRGTLNVRYRRAVTVCFTLAALHQRDLHHLDWPYEGPRSTADFFRQHLSESDLEPGLLELWRTYRPRLDLPPSGTPERLERQLLLDLYRRHRPAVQRLWDAAIR